MLAPSESSRLGRVILACTCLGVLPEFRIAKCQPPEVDSLENVPIAVPLPPHIEFERVVAGADGVVTGKASGIATGSDERLIYSNTLGVHVINFPNNLSVSDDIATTADGSSLTRYKFKVLGKVNPVGLDGDYQVTYGLYTNCPMAVGTTKAQRDLVRIPGTEGVIQFTGDAPREIEHIVPPGTSVAVPSNVYLGIRFNRANCGTVVGAPASIGFSGDFWDHPSFPCNGYLGGFPEFPHASFWLEMYVTNSADSFVGYKCNRPSSPPTLLGANITGVDDVKLIVDDCQMIAYEVVAKGVGLYTFDLRRQCESDVIPGTLKTIQVNANSQPQLQVARFVFNPPIALNSKDIWLSFKVDSGAAGTILAGVQPIIGESRSDYFEIGQDGCTPRIPITGVHGTVNLAITCAGSLPQGACCDPYLTQCAGGPDEGKRCLCNAACVGGQDDSDCCSPSSPCASPGLCEPFCAAPGTCEAVCRETTKLNCPFPPSGRELKPEWEQGASCNVVCEGGPNAGIPCTGFGDCPGGDCPAPFLEPCGLAACCHMRLNPATQQLEERCSNMSRNECEAQIQEPRPPIWQLGWYCGNPLEQRCPRTPCLFDRYGWPDCGYTGPFIDRECCIEVCNIPGWAHCCEVFWDQTCCQFAQLECRRQPGNDQCAPSYPNEGLEGAMQIPFPGSAAQDNRIATVDVLEPGFCCNTGTGVCIGGTLPGQRCVVNQDCGSGGACTERIPEQGGQGLGTIWFKWVQPAGLTTAGVHTCTSNSPALDSILQVFHAQDNSSPLAECNSLAVIGCNDDSPNCSSTQRNSRLCLRDLVPGETYYILVAAKTENRLGEYRVTLTTSCSGANLPCCPPAVGFLDPPDGVVDARAPFTLGPAFPLGITTIRAVAAPGISEDCWSVCESPTNPTPNVIALVSEGPPRMYEIRLARPITPGAVTTLTYAPGHPHAATAKFYFHPGNVNGNDLTNTIDILDLVDYLNGISTMPWGKYSTDLDHSGLTLPADILTLIEMLGGNFLGISHPIGDWYWTSLPSGEGCP